MNPAVALEYARCATNAKMHAIAPVLREERRMLDRAQIHKITEEWRVDRLPGTMTFRKHVILLLAAIYEELRAIKLNQP